MSAKAKNKLTPQQRKATLNRVLHKIRPYSAFVVCSLLVAAVSVAAQLYIPILCGDAIDKMLGKGNVDLAGVLRIAVSILVVAAVAALAQWLLSVCNNRITFSVSRDLRNEALRKIQTLPLSYLDSHPSGDIVSRMVADVDTFADGLLMGFTQLFSGILTILGTLLFMLRENVPITLVVVCITPLSLVVAGFLAKRSYGYFQSQSTVRGKQTALVNEMIEGQKVVQAFGHEAESLAAFDEVNGQLQDVSLKAIFFSSLTNPATRFVNNIVYAGVGLVGALYAVRGGISIGQLSVFLSYANQYTKPFNEISGVVTELQNALACAARVFDLLDADDPARPAPVGGVQHPLSRHLARSAHHLSRTASAVDRRYTMKRILTLGLALLMLILAGCSTEVTEYRQQQPALDIFHYFQGRTEAWGMVQDRSGKQLRRFHVAIDGDVVGDTLTLHERFVYDDGEKQQRVWRIRRTGDTRYQGTAGDIEGVASGQAAGNAFHWRYSMNVEASGSRWLLHFDDWMFLQDGSHLFNKTEMKKFGITVATVTLFFTRTTAEERTAP